MSRGDKRVNDHDSPRTPRKAIFPKGEKAQEMDYGRPDTRQLRKREASKKMADRKSKENAKKAPQLTLKERRALKRDKTQAEDPFKRKS